MSSRLLIFAVSAAAIGIGTLLWFYWRGKQRKDDEDSSNHIYRSLQLGETVDPHIMNAEIMQDNSKLKESGSGRFPILLNDMIPSYEEIPSEIFLTSVSDDAGLMQNKSISDASISENDFVVFPQSKNLLFATCCSSPSITPNQSTRVVTSENDCFDETKPMSCESPSKESFSNNNMVDKSQSFNVETSVLVNENISFDLNQVKNVVSETENVTDEKPFITEEPSTDDRGDSYPLVENTALSQTNDLEESCDVHFVSLNTTCNGTVEISCSEDSHQIKTNETLDATLTINEDIQAEDYFSATDNEEIYVKMSNLPEKLNLLVNCTLTSLTEEEAKALQDCLHGFGALRYEDEESRKHYDQILQWVLQATAFAPNIRLFVLNRLIMPLVKQLSESLHEEQLPEKSTVTILQILVNLLPHFLAEPLNHVDEEPLFWAQLKDCLNVLSSREFHPYLNSATLMSSHNVRNNVEVQMACLQLFCNLSLHITDPRYQTQILVIIMPHLSWMLICAYSWSSSDESQMQYAPKIRGLCLSCLLHVSIPMSKMTDDDVPLEVTYGACRAFHSIKVPSNTSTCINRELNSHRYHDLKEKWLRLIVNIVESAKICKDLPEIESNDPNDISPTLLSCISDSSLSLQTTMFLMSRGSTSPDIKEMAVRAAALLADVLFPRK